MVLGTHTRGTELQGKTNRNKSDNAANNNGAIGPSKKYNEDGRLALDECKRMQWGNVP